MPWLRIEEKVTLIRFIEVDEAHYPGMSVAQAKEAELDEHEVDRLEQFSESMQYAVLEGDANDFIDTTGNRPTLTMGYGIQVDEADEEWCKNAFGK
jgi:hypothetical protein